jgi:hypothetical protein
VERAQLEMQLIVARVAATAVVAIEASMRMSLEAAQQSPEDCATAAQSAATSAATERDSLALRTMCGSRTDVWSLPCVMSDWQRCVD